MKNQVGINLLLIILVFGFHTRTHAQYSKILPTKEVGFNLPTNQSNGLSYCGFEITPELSLSKGSESSSLHIRVRWQPSTAQSIKGGYQYRYLYDGKEYTDKMLGAEVFYPIRANSVSFEVVVSGESQMINTQISDIGGVLRNSNGQIIQFSKDANIESFNIQVIGLKRVGFTGTQQIMAKIQKYNQAERDGQKDVHPTSQLIVSPTYNGSASASEGNNYSSSQPNSGPILNKSTNNTGYSSNLPQKNPLHSTTASSNGSYETFGNLSNPLRTEAQNNAYYQQPYYTTEAAAYVGELGSALDNWASKLSEKRRKKKQAKGELQNKYDAPIKVEQPMVNENKKYKSFEITDEEIRKYAFVEVQFVNFVSQKELDMKQLIIGNQVIQGGVSRYNEIKSAWGDEYELRSLEVTDLEKKEFQRIQEFIESIYTEAKDFKVNLIKDPAILGANVYSKINAAMKENHEIKEKVNKAISELN